MHSVLRLRNEFGNRRIVILFEAEARIVFSINSRTVLRSIQPPIQWVTGEFSLVVKHNGYEAYHSPRPGGEIKNMHSTYGFMAGTETPQILFCILRR